MEEARNKLSKVAYNKLSVKLELQADFYAGVWAHYEAVNHHNGIVIERADIDSALTAAHQIGDDRLQQQYQAGALRRIVLPTAPARNACIGLKKGMIPAI